MEELRNQLCVNKKNFPLLAGTVDDANAYERGDAIIFSAGVVSAVFNGENWKNSNEKC